jgi:hypothetical protein
MRRAVPDLEGMTVLAKDDGSIRAVALKRTPWRISLPGKRLANIPRDHHGAAELCGEIPERAFFGRKGERAEDEPVGLRFDTSTRRSSRFYHSHPDHSAMVPDRSSGSPLAGLFQRHNGDDAGQADNDQFISTGRKHRGKQTIRTGIHHPYKPPA